MTSPAEPITTIKGIGAAISEKLDRLNIDTVGDLIRHIPRNYLDFTKQTPIKDLKEKVAGSFLATVSEPRSFYSGKGKLLTQATASDNTGKITLTWFNNPYIKRLINPGTTYSIAGTPSKFGSKLTVVAPVLEEGNSFSLNTKGLVPVYPLTEGITSKWLRKKIFETLNAIEIQDPVSSEILQKHGLPPLSRSLTQIHFPQSSDERWQSDKRLSFNEHLRINIQNRLEQQKLGSSIPVTINAELNLAAAKKIPFTLTAGQIRALSNMEKDLAKKEFTHRLIQGETGSGKTAPLLFVAGHALNSGFSCAILAPTEILANQHFDTFKKNFLFPDKVQLVTASSKAQPKKTPTVYIGTHALLNQLPERLDPPLAFLAIDEQHKFGVSQRETLLKRKPLPHLFNLSATPIPRTVALGLLGDIEISNIAGKPDNREPVKTHVVSPGKFKDSPKWLISELAKGNQIFVVCPHIADNQSGISSVEFQTKNYRKIIPAAYPVYSIHGKMTREEQAATLEKFKSAQGAVLVATSLIEVGIDIPTANIMIIHSAERFGLAQLHQLRGRVGRGKEQGYCFLVPSIDDDVEKERLRLLQKYHSGLLLAQKDLRLRGAGDIYGEKQHGRLPTRLKYFWSKKLFGIAKQEAKKLVEQDAEKAVEIARKLLTW